MRRALAPALLAFAAAAAAPAGAAERSVTMPGKFFEPPTVTALVGDTVTWSNSDVFAHDVEALDASFDSGSMAPGAKFSVRFDRAGRVPYRCTIHPFMAGTIEVYAFELRGPAVATAVRRRAVLRGTAPGGVRTVTIEQRRRDGSYAAVATAAVAPGGSFRAAVVPTGPAVYRAVAGGETSLPLALPVSARLATTARRLHGGRVLLHTVARPAQPGAPAALQLYSRERYAWRQVAHGRLDGRSRVSFTVRTGRPLRARVVLLKGRKGYAPAVGPQRRIRPQGTGR